MTLQACPCPAVSPSPAARGASAAPPGLPYAVCGLRWWSASAMNSQRLRVLNAVQMSQFSSEARTGRLDAALKRHKVLCCAGSQ